MAEIQSGMVVGLGTGRTATRAVNALAERVKEEGLDIQCVPTSHATETTARFLGLKLLDSSMVEKVDYLFDGADEVDPNLKMLKGAGGAIVRERIVAWASERRVYIVEESKLVDHLGQRAPLAVAVMSQGLTTIRNHLRELGLNGVVRRSMDGQLFLTDHGHLILDCKLDDRDLDDLACMLNEIPGVVDHGLFICEANEVLVQMGSGKIERMTKPPEEEE